MGNVEPGVSTAGTASGVPCSGTLQFQRTGEAVPGRASLSGGFPPSSPLAYTDGVQLRTARLCLDCEEIHEAQMCPVCASESFAYLIRWIPADERRARNRARTQPRPDGPAEQSGRTAGLVGRGALGLALVAGARWLWRLRADMEDSKKTDS